MTPDGHSHARGGHGHSHDHGHRGLRGALAGLRHPHRHDHADSLDDALLADQAGRRALAISLAGLLATGAVQAVIVGFSGSVGLLADTIHNLADALTALPIGLAFWAARRSPTSRYTYGYGRAEDLAGLAVVGVMTTSAAVAAWQAIDRFIHPHQVHDLPWVAAAGVIRDIYRRLMDAVDPGLTTRIERETLAIPAVLGCDGVKVRWIGHELHAELNITVDGGLTVRQAHDITEDARHQLLHHVGRLTDAIIHVNPPESSEAHARTAHHVATARPGPR